MADKIETGMDTESIAELIDLTIPPMRPEGHGITVSEQVKQSNITKSMARAILDGRDDLTPIKTRNYNGGYVTVYLPNEEAQAYQNWIIKEI